MSPTLVATVVSLVLSFVGIYGVSEEKYPWVHNIRTWRSLPGWFLIFYPEVGKWALRVTQQDFEVAARGNSPLTPFFNYLTTEPGHGWMFIVGWLWIAGIAFFWPRRGRLQQKAIIAESTPARTGQAVAALAVQPVRPVKRIDFHKPVRTFIYRRRSDYNAPIWLSETAGSRSYGLSHEGDIYGVLARFSAPQYISNLTSRLTYYDASKKEMITLYGCWLDAMEHNHLALRVGDIGSVVMFFYANGEHVEYGVADDKRHQYPRPFEEIRFLPCALAEGWTIKINLFLDGKEVPECWFECFTGADGKMQVRSSESTETSE